MLRLSTKGRYGLRAMIELAHAFDSDETPVMMGDIAERQEISRKYLHALLTSLKHAGLVRSTRGAKGGYTLARPPSNIKVSDIFIALEGTLAIVDCLHDPGTCKRGEDCPSRAVWSDLNNAIFRLLDGMTLRQLAGAHQASEDPI